MYSLTTDASGRLFLVVLLSFLPAQLVALFSTPLNATSPAPKLRHAIPLHRQRVPVRSDEGVLSFKSVYFGTIFVGAPNKQKFSMVFDTGSGHVIVPSIACEKEACTMHRRYNHALSGIAQEIEHDGTPIKPGEARDQITVAFGTGEVTGQFAHDRLCLDVAASASDDTAVTAPAEAAPPGCVDMRLVTATEMSEEPFSSFSFDGVLGLGLDALALAPEFSFFGMMARSGGLQHETFGVFLAESDDDFSEISFGGHNPDRVKTADLNWAPVALPDLGYWMVRILAIRVGGRRLDFCDDGECRAVVDTGTSLLAVPGGFTEELKHQLGSTLKDPPANADGTIDCRRAMGSLLEFDIEGSTLELDPGDYARPSVQMNDGDDEAAEAAATAALSGEEVQRIASRNLDANSSLKAAEDEKVLAKCHPTLMPIDLPEPLGPKLFILGEPVLKKYYTTYDWHQKRIGFGLAVHKHGNYDEPKEMEEPLLGGPLFF
jgi:hypothetical protein